MKEHLSIAERNRIVETHLGRIDSVMQSKRSIIRSIRMERDDIYQQLAVRLILAVAGFDNSDRSIAVCGNCAPARGMRFPVLLV